MTVYLVNKFTKVDDDQHDIDFVGVFSSEDKAEEAMDSFEKDEGVTFFVEAYDVDVIQQPISEVAKNLSTLEELIKNDVVDYTIDENGDFVFELTEKGKEIIGE